jgi:nucleotide-binding universal stress UspA family protein
MTRAPTSVPYQRLRTWPFADRKKVATKERTMYANIMIPTDGSELAGNAVQDEIALAKRIGAKVTVREAATAPRTSRHPTHCGRRYRSISEFLARASALLSRRA